MTEVRNLLSGVNYCLNSNYSYELNSTQTLWSIFTSETFHRKFANLLAELRKVNVN